MQETSLALRAAADRQSHCQNQVSLMAAEPPSPPSTPSLPPPTLPLPLRSLTLTASPQPLTFSARITETVAAADHSPSSSPNPNYEYIFDSDHLVDYVPVDHVDVLMSDPVDDPLIDLNIGDQHVAADVVRRWKQIRVDDLNSGARTLPSLQLASGQH